MSEDKTIIDGTHLLNHFLKCLRDKGRVTKTDLKNGIKEQFETEYGFTEDNPDFKSILNEYYQAFLED